MTPTPRPRGYALILVVLFVALYLGLWGMVARQVGTMLRIEQARSRRIAQDAADLPALSALAKGLAALEVGYPPASFYVVGVPGTGFMLAYTMVDGATAGSSWTVQIVPAGAQAEPTDPNHPDLDPAQFQPAPPGG